MVGLPNFSPNLDAPFGSETGPPDIAAGGVGGGAAALPGDGLRLGRGVLVSIVEVSVEKRKAKTQKKGETLQRKAHSHVLWGRTKI